MDLRNNRITGLLTGLDIKNAALIVQFLVSVSFNLMGSFLPLYIEVELQYSLIESTYWTGTAQLISSSLYAFTAPFWGSMCDRVGIKKITMMVLAVNAVVYAGMGLSHSITEILLFRGLQGAFGGMSTAMFALVAVIVPAGELKRALSYQMAVMTMGSLVGPGIGGLLASVLGYRLTFVISSLFFLSIVPLIISMNMPHPSKKTSEEPRFDLSAFRTILPDVFALILVYACISFIGPMIPWFIESLGVPDDELLTYTALTTILNGLAFVAATPVLTRIVTDRILPILSAVAAGAIFVTAFVTGPYQFIALRVSIGAIQAGIPPSLLGGGRSKRGGTVMGFLNSARFLGMAVGPFIATSILGDGEPSRVLAMYTAMALISLFTSFVLYLTHVRARAKGGIGSS